MAKPRYFDIGVNLTDSMFHGVYNGKKYHESDLEQVLLRARTFNVQKLLLTGSSLSESETILQLAGSYPIPNYLFTTVGVHPCTVNEIDSLSIEDQDDYLTKLYELTVSGVKTGIVKAFGEIGLDYDRLHYSSKEVQQKFFQKQLDIAVKVQLPLFLHMRSSNDDFIKIIKPYLPQLPKLGVVHSFTGTTEELNQLLDLGFYIGVNGCSLKTEENLEVVKQIPLDRLLVETDAPWCEIRKSSAGYKYLTPYPNETYPRILTKQSSQLNLKLQTPPTVKLDPLLPFPLLKKDQFNNFNPISPQSLIGVNSSPLIKSRNEPVHIGQVVEIIANLKQVPVQTIIDHAWENTIKLFGIEETEADEFFDY